MKDTKNLLKRVREMQDRYDDLTRVLAGLDEAISEYKSFKPDLERLEDYLNSGQLKADASIDDAGQIPSEIKRGVLYEDGLSSLLQGADKVKIIANRTLMA